MSGSTRTPTLADVADAAGVSLSTASLTFSGNKPVSSTTRERVLAAAAALGYAGPNPLARNLRQGRSGLGDERLYHPRPDTRQDGGQSTDLDAFQR